MSADVQSPVKDDRFPESPNRDVCTFEISTNLRRTNARIQPSRRLKRTHSEDLKSLENRLHPGCVPGGIDR